jgi:protein-disulfide isomerase
MTIARTATSLLVVSALSAAWYTIQVMHDVRNASPIPGAPVRKVTDWASYTNAVGRIGPPNAPVQIVFFSDFRNPQSRAISLQLAALRQRHRNRVQVLFRYLPLRQDSLSVQAALASVCASRFGRFEELHNLLVALPASVRTIQWNALAVRAGISDTSAFTVCRAHLGTSEIVSRDELAAKRLGIQSAPAYLVNQFLVEGVLGENGLDRLAQLSDVVGGE